MAATTSLAAWRAATPYTTRAALVAVTALAAARWVWTFVAPPHLPARARWAAAVPVLAFYACAWAAFDPRLEVVGRTMTAFAFTWLGIFKVLGLLLGRGPLSPVATGRNWTWPQFAFILSLPVSPRYAGGAAEAGDAPPPSRGSGPAAAAGRRGRPAAASGLHRVSSRNRVGEAAATGVHTRARVAAGKAATLATVVALLERDRLASAPGGDPARALPAAARPWCYLFGLYTFLGLVYDAIGAAATATPCLRLDLSPHFDHPFLSTSFADLWGRRWNLIAGHSLRFLVYDPIVEGRLMHGAGGGGGAGVKSNGSGSGGRPARRPTPSRRTAALAAAFAASGLMHEVILAIVTPGLSRYTGWWGLFFSSWALVLAAERRAGAAWRGAGLPFPLPAWVAAPLTVSAGIAAGAVGFVRPAVETGLADRLVVTLRGAVDAVAGWGGWLGGGAVR
jgi:hypothetical protein